MLILESENLSLTSAPSLTIDKPCIRVSNVISLNLGFFIYYFGHKILLID